MSAAVQLSHCAYGKTGVRLIKVERHGRRHDLRDINVAIQLSGAFEAAYSEGDNRSVLPTDTMKNTVYVLARRLPLGEIENFGMRIADHFLTHNSHLTGVQITLSENIWERISSDGGPHDTSFQMSGPASRTAVIDASRTKKSIRAGIKDLVVLKTSGSAFENFLHDEYTTLQETRNRLLASSVNAQWSYNSEAPDFNRIWLCVRAILLDAFAAHDSRSVQHTLFAMGQAALQQVNAIEQIWLSMPNRHCIPVDLSPFSLDNPNEVFVSLEEPSGLIEATLNRAGFCPDPA
jgi:urate oxidase